MAASTLSGNSYVASVNTKIPVLTSLATSIRVVTGVATAVTLYTVPADAVRFIPTYVVMRDASATMAALIAQFRRNTAGGTQFGTLAVSTGPTTSALATVYPMGTQVGTTGVQNALLPLSPGDSVVLNIATPSAGATDTAVFDVYGFWVEGI